MDLEGRLLGNRYEIIEKIGNGGMAMVYKAKCHVLNRFVAVKILRDEFTTDQEFIKRFEVEAQAAASITHPNIVSVYDVGKEGNLYYIVMELIQGKTLKEIIVEEEGPLPWKWSINIAIQIASALEVAHKNNIVHRDIKPHNIIITEDGVAKVTDFGIAKAVSNSTITAFGTTIGSVHYFSPEHARGGYTDAKSDLYSLGVVMYEMLTGKVPFDADTPVSIALKHMQEEPKAPKELNEKIPVAVNDIILKSMRKDTNLRYQNAASMLSDLKRALKDPEGNFVDNQDYEENMPTQKISIKDIEEEKERFLPLLKDFSNISVRENDAQEFLNGNGIISELTLDPTLLMNKEEWKKVIKDVKINEPYILYYSVNSRKYSIDLTKRISKELGGIKVINLVLHPKSAFSGFENKIDYAPEEFLALINNAKMICTNSFHGTVFSIIFEKPFVAMFDMKDEKIVKEQRKYTLLKELGLEDRIYTSKSEINIQEMLKVNYKESKERLERLRNKSLKYIKESLK